MIYVAYGSNLNRDQMEFRVPGAKVLGKGFIHNWKLDFHGKDGNAYATISQAFGYKVPVILWELSDKEETTMDSYEGFPTAYYKKKIAVYLDNNEKRFGTVYIMNESRTVARPDRKYVNTIRQGYMEFKIDINFLEDALVRNAMDFYNDNVFEVREFKTIKPKEKSKKQKGVYKQVINWKPAKKGKKPKVKKDSYAYPDYDSCLKYLGYSSEYCGGRKPSLDDYDNL